MIWGAERRACEVAEEWTRVGPTCGTRWTLSGPVALFFGLALLSLRGRVKALTVLVLLADVVAFGETLAERGVDHVLWPRGTGLPAGSRPCNGRVGLSQNGEPPHSHAAYVESSDHCGSPRRSQT
jgi:hypothetical protein